MMNTPSTWLTAAAALAFGAAAALAQTAPDGVPGKPPTPRETTEQAPAPADGYLNAFACEALDAPLRVEVELLDNTEENMRLHGIFVEQLAKSGVQVAPGAKLVLSLDIEHVREGRILKPGDMVDVRVGGSATGSANGVPGNTAPTTDDDAYARVHMNIWSNRRDSVIGGRRDTVEQESVDQLHVVINVNSREDGRCLWRGEAIHNLDAGDPRRIGDALMRYMATRIGKPASRRPIRLNF